MEERKLQRRIGRCGQSLDAFPESGDSQQRLDRQPLCRPGPIKSYQPTAGSIRRLDPVFFSWSKQQNATALYCLSLYRYSNRLAVDQLCGSLFCWSNEWASNWTARVLHTIFFPCTPGSFSELTCPLLNQLVIDTNALSNESFQNYMFNYISRIKML